MASGKTTIGKRISELSGYKFIDTEEMIVKKECRTINEIFDKDGEEYFREVERSVVYEVSKMNNMVISTGGGVVLDKKNIEVLRKNGRVFNLSPDFSVIESRLLEAAKSRPLLKNDSIEDIKKRFDNRIPFYDNCDKKVHISMETTVDETAYEILEEMKKLK